jgi:hypothetical protein
VGIHPAFSRDVVSRHRDGNIKFTANGILMIAFGFLVRELHLSPVALKLWFAMLQIGT